jgi:hypothetical protein
VTDAPAEHRPGRGRLTGLGPYLVAGALYVALGVWEPRVLLSWAEGIAFVMLVVWAIPALIGRWRR